MSKRKKRDAAASATAAGSGRWRGAAVVVLVGAAVALAWATWRPTSEPAPTPAPAPANTGVPAPPASSSGAYAVLVGEWVRPDGGYVLAVSAVAADGKATASYFNPRPIHVARAEAKLEGALVSLFVELRDANYPGSTYTLGYDTATDQLKGSYYQAVQGAQYEVVFSRRR